MAYAIVQTGGKQYRVSKNDTIEVEKLVRVTGLPSGKAAGKPVMLDEVLFYSDGKKVEIGKPYLKGVKVQCEVLGDVKGKKVVSFKYKRRKGYRRKVGHRQKLTMLKIQDITIE